MLELLICIGKVSAVLTGVYLLSNLAYWPMAKADMRNENE